MFKSTPNININIITKTLIVFLFIICLTVFHPTLTSASTSSIEKYYYNQLTETEQQVYNQLYTAIYNFNESTIIELPNNTSNSIIGLIYSIIKLDNPELYYCGNKLTYITISPNTYEVYPSYLMTKEEKEQEDINLRSWIVNYKNYKYQHQTSNTILSDYQLEEIICNYIKRTARYNLSSSYNQSLISVVHGETVCMGYSKAFKYLCDLESIPCVIVEGLLKSTNGAHAWNMVLLDNEWYVVDVTNTFNYNYNCSDMFNINKTIAENNLVERDLKVFKQERKLQYPEITNSIAYDWYTINGLYLNSFEEIKDALLKNQYTLTFRTNKTEEIIKFINNNWFIPKEIEIIIDKQRSTVVINRKNR